MSASSPRHPSLRRISRGWIHLARATRLLLAVVLATLLCGAGCESEPRIQQGWVPTPDGPLWATYRVEGDEVVWGGDVRFPVFDLLAYQAEVTKPRPLEVTRYDIPNGTLSDRLDDTYDGETGDPSVRSTFWPQAEWEMLAGGLGKLTDGSWPAPGEDAPELGVAWNLYSPPPLVFHLDGVDVEAPIDSIVLRGYGITRIEIAAGGRELSRTFPHTEESRTYRITDAEGLGIVGDRVELTIVPESSFVNNLYEVSFETGVESPEYRASVEKDEGWKDGAVPYELEGYAPCSGDCPLNWLGDAIAHWEAQTVYDFQEDPDAQPRVKFHYCASSDTREACRTALDGGTCYVDGVGKPGEFLGIGEKVRDVYLHDGCDFGRIVHEIGHAVGFYHEQARRDRNAWITVNTKNVMPGRGDQFEPAGSSFGEYNYRSIMHYGPTYFSRVACCADATVDTRQNGLPDGCGWLQDVGVMRNGAQVCPSATQGDAQDLPYRRAMQTIVADVSFPSGFPELAVGQLKELSKGDVTAANALALGDFGIRSFNSLFEVGYTGVAPESTHYRTGDLNGDGHADLVGFSSHVHVYFGQPDGTLVGAGTWAYDLCGPTAYCEVGNLDADEYDDVVVFHEDGRVEVLWSDGGGLFTIAGEEIVHPTFGQRAAGGTRFFLADVDADCDHDIVAIDMHEVYSGRITVRVALSGGGKFTVAERVETWLDDPSAYYPSIAVGDVDQDRMADLALLGDGVVLLSNGSGYDPEATWLGSDWCGVLTGPCQLADLDGDGRMDVVETDLRGETHRERLRYALSTGYRFRTDVPNYHELDCRNSAQRCLFGDVDGDGRADVIDATPVSDFAGEDPGRNPGGVWISLNRRIWSEDVGPRKYVLGGSSITGSCEDLGLDPQY